MGLNIKNREAKRQARQSMRRSPPSRSSMLQSVLERRIWPAIPMNVLGQRLSKEAEEKILGFGPSGV
jgi:hypothetical protein